MVKVQKYESACPLPASPGAFRHRRRGLVSAAAGPGLVALPIPRRMLALAVAAGTGRRGAVRCSSAVRGGTGTDGPGSIVPPLLAESPLVFCCRLLTVPSALSSQPWSGMARPSWR
jgi:hypothetical protein